MQQAAHLSQLLYDVLRFIILTRHKLSSRFRLNAITKNQGRIDRPILSISPVISREMCVLRRDGIGSEYKSASSHKTFKVCRSWFAVRFIENIQNLNGWHGRICLTRAAISHNLNKTRTELDFSVFSCWRCRRLDGTTHDKKIPAG